MASISPNENSKEENDNVLVLDGSVPQALESLCVACGNNGTTNFLRRDIPFFHDVIIASFSCPHCGYRSSSLNIVNIAERGVHYELSVVNPKDLDREIIRTEHASIKIPELELEIPANMDRKGEINTLEGIINQFIDSLQEAQPLRKVFFSFFLYFFLLFI